MSKYTPWFPGTVKPMHVGWYQVNGSFYENECDPRCKVMRYWNGKRWQWASPFLDGRLVGAAVSPSSDIWRGLARKPK